MYDSFREYCILVCVIIAIVFFGLVVVFGFNRARTNDWVEIEGIVVEVKKIQSSSVVVSGNVPVVIPRNKYEVTYHIEVDGVVYGGCEKIGLSYIVGESINIKYNPDNPTESCIN